MRREHDAVMAQLMREIEEINGRNQN